MMETLLREIYSIRYEMEEDKYKTCYNVKFSRFRKNLGSLIYSKTCVKRTLENRQNKDLNAGRKYCRMLTLEHSAILLTCINP